MLLPLTPPIALPGELLDRGLVKGKEGVAVPPQSDAESCLICSIERAAG